MMKRIVLENIQKSYKGAEILKNVTCTFEGGKTYGITGINGSGKSVLLSIIIGVLKPDKGDILIYADKKIRQAVAIDSTELFPYMNAKEALIYLASFRKEIGLSEIEEVLKRMDLSKCEKKQIRHFSVGMKKRLLIAQAIMEDNDLYIFDEPTNGLDEAGVKLFYEIINELREKEKTIIITSHCKEDIKECCDEVFELKEGIIL